MNVTIYLPLVTLLLGGGCGYYLGRYQSLLINRIKLLEKPKPVETTPTITMGAYSPPTSSLSEDSKSKVGIVEAKTPQLVAWESEQRIEKEALGR